VLVAQLRKFVFKASFSFRHCGLDPQSLENQQYFFKGIAGQARNDAFKEVVQQALRLCRSLCHFLVQVTLSLNLN